MQVSFNKEGYILSFGEYAFSFDDCQIIDVEFLPSDIHDAPIGKYIIQDGKVIKNYEFIENNNNL